MISILGGQPPLPNASGHLLAGQYQEDKLCWCSLFLCDFYFIFIQILAYVIFYRQLDFM